MEKYIVFDIETSPLPWDSFSESQQEFLLRNLETEVEIEKRKKEFGLSPFTAQIVCIGLLYIEKDENGKIKEKPVAFCVDNDLTDEEEIQKKIEFDADMIIKNEKQVLESFWRLLEKHSDAHLVSFNGRNFDSPFLMIRSAIHRIKPSRNLMAGTKYNYPMHTDLIDEITFYQPTFYFSATKRFNLDFYTRAFGIESPKSFGVDGTKVADLFANKEFEAIATYCLRDVISTWKLYEIWEQTLKF